VVSDGTSVLGLGDIGAHAAMPVMEGKSHALSSYSVAGCLSHLLDTRDIDDSVLREVHIPSFGGSTSKHRRTTLLWIGKGSKNS